MPDTKAIPSDRFPSCEETQDIAHAERQRTIRAKAWIFAEKQWIPDMGDRLSEMNDMAFRQTIETCA